MALLSAILFQNSSKDGSAIKNVVSKFCYRRHCYQQSYSKFRHRRLCYQQSYYKIPPTDGSAIGHLFQNSTNRWLCYRPSYLRIPPYMLVSAILFKNSATLRLCCSSKILHKFHNIFICKLCYDIFINYLF